MGDLTSPFFYKGEWVQIDWTSRGIASMNLLLDLSTGIPLEAAIRRYGEALSHRDTKRRPGRSQGAS